VLQVETITNGERPYGQQGHSVFQCNPKELDADAGLGGDAVGGHRELNSNLLFVVAH
jgi:hypothetical protein